MRINKNKKQFIENPNSQLLRDVRKATEGKSEQDKFDMTITFFALLVASNDKGEILFKNDEVLERFINKNFQYLKKHTLNILKLLYTN